MLIGKAMSEFSFSPGVENVLRQFGWSPDRNVSIANWLDRLKGEGLTTNAVAERVLSNLGGLTITPPTNEDNQFAPSKIEFDPVKAAGGESDRVLSWQEDFNLKLFPVGRYDPLFIILISADGRVF